VIHEERESQLSAMFDGELPATECELLSRRIDRDEVLRARWSRYALIGAAMRSEPVATARSGFARRVSVALRGGGEVRPRSGRRGRIVVNAALSASLVVAVAGLSISLLRYNAGVSGGTLAGSASDGTIARLAVDQTPAVTPDVHAVAAAPVRGGAPAVDAALLASSVAAPASIAAGSAASSAALRRGGSTGRDEPVSYVTPASAPDAHTALRTELADFIVAHSEYSSPLMRRNLLSELVSNEDDAEFAAPGAAVMPSRAAPMAGALHAIIAPSATSR
jgi:hypothetical protein